MESLDIVVPCYNEEACINLLYKEVNRIMNEEDHNESINWRILFINDGSTDNTLKEIKKIADVDERIKYISFSRNFGKESAIYAGLTHSKAEYVALMDADLQHPPELLHQMIKELDNGYDCCGARRVDRKGEPPARSFLSRVFYKAINHMTSMRLVQGGSDFRMMKRNMVEAVLSLPERERFTKGILSWVGFDTKWIDYENVERSAGTTKWSFKSLLFYAINGYFSFATAPLRIAIWLGFIIDFVTIIATIIFIVRNINSNGPRTGFGTLVCLIAFFGGTIILILGLIGDYLSRIYFEVKRRPIFLVKDTNIGERSVIKNDL